VDAAIAAVPEDADPATTALAAWLAEEHAALELLAAGLAAFGGERYTEADIWLSRLVERHRGSLAFAAVSRPGSSCLPR
jgi:hypothetical protein